jgi:hypothetical protein
MTVKIDSYKSVDLKQEVKISASTATKIKKADISRVGKEVT